MDGVSHFQNQLDGNTALLTAIATFGIIGVGASEILSLPILVY